MEGEKVPVAAGCSGSVWSPSVRGQPLGAGVLRPPQVRGSPLQRVGGKEGGQLGRAGQRPFRDQTVPGIEKESLTLKEKRLPFPLQIRH